MAKESESHSDATLVEEPPQEAEAEVAPNVDEYAETWLATREQDLAAEYEKNGTREGS